MVSPTSPPSLTLNVAGALIIEAPHAPGACGSGRGGVIVLTSTARVLADATCAAGAISLTAAGDIEVAGLVEAAGGGPGANPAAARGGPITVVAGSRLTVTGRISRRGLDAGADLVHLESGLDTTLRGPIESRGGVDNGGATTGCTGRAGKPAGATACLEVWAGRALVIDGSALSTSVLAVDAGDGGRPGACCGWLDALAGGNITLTGPVLAGRNPVFAVSARQTSPGVPDTLRLYFGEIRAPGR